MKAVKIHRFVSRQISTSIHLHFGEWLSTINVGNLFLLILRKKHELSTYPLSLWLNLLFYERGEPLWKPFLAPVLGANQEPEPGVRDLMSQSHAHARITRKKGLGKKHQIGTKRQKKRDESHLGLSSKVKVLDDIKESGILN